MSDSSTIVTHLERHVGELPGADDTAKIATYIRSHWGSDAIDDAAMIASYESATGRTLAQWAQQLRDADPSLVP